MIGNNDHYIPIRLYIRHAIKGDRTPVLIYIHGGGNLCASMLLKDHEKRVKLAMLIYGVYDVNDADHLCYQ